MTILVYGGTFNPPHLGHFRALEAARAQLSADRTVIIPTGEPPHKALDAGSATARERLELTRLAFSGLEGVQVSDAEIRRGGKSYTADTLRSLAREYPGADLVLLLGTDMLTTFTRWHDFEWMLGNVTLAAFPRSGGDREVISACAAKLTREYDAHILGIRLRPVEISSSALREALPERGGRRFLTDAVYSRIIKSRMYGAKPDFAWLREKSYACLKPNRIPHVRGCEEEAVRLAARYGEDTDEAAEAAILHDVTKRLDVQGQNALCEKYGVETDAGERNNAKLLHSKTGAALAKAEFGVSGKVAEAIKWHTTGKAGMSLFEKILYIADYIEPTRDFPGVGELRRLAYEDIDRAMLLGLRMSLDDLKGYGVEPHKNTIEALEYLKKELL